MREWDYLIVGAGSAGCALAYELVTSGRNSVLLLEAGGDDRSPNIKIPALVGNAGEKFGWDYTSQPDPTRGGATEKWRRGRVLGGSSSINGMVYVRGAAHDFDRWAAKGNAGWSAAEVLPLFQELEHSDQQSPLRGKAGPLFIRTVNRAHPLTHAFLQSANEAGFPFNPDYNAERQEGVSYVQLSQRWGLRWSAADAFVRPILGQPNFKLLLNTHVHRIQFSGTRAQGVLCTQDGKPKKILARRIVICAGAIDTPKLLMLSGVGDAAELQRHGIDTVAHSPDVGCNLQEHPLVRLVYESRIPSNNLTGGILQKIKIAAQFALHRQGPISGAFEAVGFLKSAADLQHPDIQIHFLPIGLADFGDHQSPLLNYPSVTVYVNASYPKSRGRTRLSSANPADAPIIECGMHGDDRSDLESLQRGIQVVRRIMAAGPMRDILGAERVPGHHYASDQALKDYIPAHTEIAYHVSGTCRMGSDATAVVTPQLSVNGIENLWIADASIMPDLISGNTNAACMMIGKKLGKWLTALGSTSLDTVSS